MLAVLLVGFLFIQNLFKNSSANKANEGNGTGKRYVPNPAYEYKLTKSNSILHLFKNGAVCSDAKVCSEIGK